MPKAKSKAEPKASSSKAVVSWKDRMAVEAQTAKGMEKGIGASNFFSTKNGKLTYNDQQMPNNEMAVIVLDYVLENTFYDEDYDPDNPASPTCFAFGTDEDDMAPHADSSKPEADSCKECWANKFGSADKGKGKACRNSRRLALTPAGKIDREGEMEPNTDPDYYTDSDVAFLKIPPTSLKGWAQFVREVGGVYGTPPMGVFTHVSIEDDNNDQFHVNFRHNGPISDDMGNVILNRIDQIRDSEALVQPYQAIEADEPPPKKGRGRSAPAKKKAASKRGSRKY